MTDPVTQYIKTWAMAVNASDPKTANWCASWLAGYGRARSMSNFTHEGIPIAWDAQLPEAKGRSL